MLGRRRNAGARANADAYPHGYGNRNTHAIADA
jgi:hypothetical protein